eukprot:125372-Hanusia_phi.AAC.1
MCIRDSSCSCSCSCSSSPVSGVKPPQRQPAGGHVAWSSAQGRVSRRLCGEGERWAAAASG